MPCIDNMTLQAALGNLRQPLSDGTRLGDHDRKLLAMLVQQSRILLIPDGLAEHPDHVAYVGAAAAARAGDLPLIVCAQPERQALWGDLAESLGLAIQLHPDPDMLDDTFPAGYALVLDMRGFARSAYTCDNAVIVVARDTLGGVCV
ncbi:hypothetical protein SE17_04405 [Kouleothrix aurantiaca]|uniref:Uncharacterized protein n=1 Tax=Kouleothrix aurantiaca TaxID=186479 RepID=A0A0P9D9D0_9CHLR|nr:hypothetical protein SE17_04405 [Kouleothrix aurantiaca]